MPDSRPNANLWGNIITCGEIAFGIYEIVGDKSKGIMMSKADAKKILPEAVAARGEPEGENLCFTDELSPLWWDTSWSGRDWSPTRSLLQGRKS